MLRVIRSTVQGLNIDADLEDDYAAAAEAGELLHETYTGDKNLTIEVRAYTDPAGQNRFAVLYSHGADIDWQDTPDYTEARNSYEESVRETEKGVPVDVDDDGNEVPLFETTDVRGVANYEEGSEESGEAEAYLLLAEWATAEAEKAQEIAAEKTQARQAAYALAIDTFGRGGNAVLARRVGKSEPTVKDIADRGRLILEAQRREQFSVDLFEDNAGGLYLRKTGDTTGWFLGAGAEHTCGPFTDDAKAWRDGDWEPNQGDGQTPDYGMDVTNLTHIATWSAKKGLKVINGQAGGPAAGAAGSIYLKLTRHATTLGGWGNYTPHGTIEESAIAALGDAAGQYNIAGIARDWRQAVNDALPDGVSLTNVAFTGPVYPNFPMEGLELDAVINEVDFQKIAARHKL
ncbi:hypothetical protein ACWFRT_13875 [Streptomyces anulatus]